VKRNSEIKRIMQENEQLLKRLLNRQSNYNVFEWENARKMQVKNLKRISRYNLSISKDRK